MADQITDLEALAKEINPMAEEIAKRATIDKVLEKYYDGEHPVPEAVKSEKKTQAYTRLMEMGRTNWPKLVVESVEERLELQDIVFADAEVTAAVRRAWQDNGMDAEWPLALQSSFTIGRSYVNVWADEDDRPVIDTDHASTTIVRYAVGSRRKRDAALRLWSEGDRWFATLYHPHFIYRLEGDEKSSTTPTKWKPREMPDGEDWTNPNEFGEVPVVEVAVNRSLKPSRYGTYKGEFADALGHIDRINYTIFSLLVAMTWSGFPLRGAIGDPILRDDDGNMIKPFDVAADTLVAVENPEGKLVQLPEATLTNFIAAAEMHIRHFAAVTGTPAHYLLAELINIAADAIRAAEARLISKCRKHRRYISESALDVARLVAKITHPDVERDPSAHVKWRDMESRSMAERADAAVKLKDILPWQALAEKVLGASPAEIAVWEAQRASETVGLALPADMKAKADALGVMIRSGVDGASAARLVGLDDASFTGAVPTTLRLPETEAAALETA